MNASTAGNAALAPARRRKPTCRHCGSDEVVRDATAAWDPDLGEWVLAGVFDSESCGACGADSNTLAIWVDIPLDPSLRCNDGQPVPN